MARVVLHEGGDATLFVPYSEQFLADFKWVVPRYWRRWQPETKSWWVEAAYVDDAIAVVKRVFGRCDIVHDAAQPRSAPFSDDALIRQVRDRFPDHAVLGILPGADDALVLAAYRAAAQRHHPDRGGDTATMTKVNLAYERLRAH
jgi:hypothetical protein